MILNLDTKYNGGLGDAVWFAWLGEGSKASTDPLAFHTKSAHKMQLLTMLGQTVSDQWRGAVDTSPAYEAEIRGQGSQPRYRHTLDLLQRHDITPLRPTVALNSGDMDWAFERLKTKKGRPLVLLFPESQCRARTYPLPYWMDLSEALYHWGAAPVAIYVSDHLQSHFRSSVQKIPLDRLAALMTRAALVVGNDSFPAHLSSTIGTPTLVILGPTTRQVVFGHCPDDNPQAITASIECTGCLNNLKYYRPACLEQCQSMMLLTPDKVLDRCAAMLKGGA